MDMTRIESEVARQQDPARATVVLVDEIADALERDGDPGTAGELRDARDARDDLARAVVANLGAIDETTPDAQATR